MKKLILLTFVIGLLLVVAVPVFAEDIGLKAQEDGAMWRMMDLAPANLDAQDNPEEYYEDNGNVYKLTKKIDTITVEANKSEPTFSLIKLEEGKIYTLRVSGTAFAGDTIEFDAKYSLTNRLQGDTWTDKVSGYEIYGTKLLDLLVDGSQEDWGNYTATLVYHTDVTGTGNLLKLQIYDIYYQNNYGFLTVEIYPHD